MATPLNLLLARLARPPQLARPIGRCPVCREDVREGDESMTIRGGVRVHRACASYRMRQLSRRG
jgi:hypothetical protein